MAIAGFVVAFALCTSEHPKPDDCVRFNDVAIAGNMYQCQQVMDAYRSTMPLQNSEGLYFMFGCLDASRAQGQNPKPTVKGSRL